MEDFQKIITTLINDIDILVEISKKLEMDTNIFMSIL